MPINYSARIVYQHDTHWFVSLDGEWYVEVSADPRDASRASVEKAHGPDEDGYWQIKLARRWLRQRHARFFDPPKP